MSAQQAEHRFAPSGIAVKQSGQSFVFGGGGGAARKRFTAFTTRNTTNAMIRKLTRSLINWPYAITGNPLNCASASDTGRCPERSINRFEKSALPRAIP